MVSISNENNEQKTSDQWHRRRFKSAVQVTEPYKTWYVSHIYSKEIVYVFIDSKLNVKGGSMCSTKMCIKGHVDAGTQQWITLLL